MPNGPQLVSVSYRFVANVELKKIKNTCTKDMHKKDKKEGIDSQLEKDHH